MLKIFFNVNENNLRKTLRVLELSLTKNGDIIFYCLYKENVKMRI